MFFVYEVIDKNKNSLKGRVEASSRTSAISLLQSKGYTIVKLIDEKKSLNIELFNKVSGNDLVIFSRQIATLFEAEISALRAFNLVSEHIRNDYFRGILNDIARRIESGSSVENAFRVHENIFGSFFVNIVSVGETSGTLSRSFSYLADYLERYYELTSRVRRSLTYPIFVIVVFVIVMFLMFVTVIPQIASILTESGQELPKITQIILGISDFLRSNVLIIFIGLISVIIGLVFYYRTSEGRKSFHRFFVTMPILGRLFREFYLVRFADNMSVMLSSGVPIVKAVDSIKEVIGNVVYEEILDDIGKSIRQGSSLSNAVASHKMLGENISQIIKVGEETGELSKMLKTVADFYQQQLTVTIETIIDLIQPTIIVFLGVGVGVLLGSVILPIYSLAGSI